MKGETCIICSYARGKRVCRINNNSLICPICCAKTRNENCEGCDYYSKADQFKKQNASGQKSSSLKSDFIMEINEDVNERVDRALELAEKGKLREAESKISTLLIKHPNIDLVQYGMGVICLMKNKFKEAIVYFDRAININPYFVEAWFNKGAAHQKTLEISEMIKAYRKTVEFGEPGDRVVIHAKNTIKMMERQIRKNNQLSLDEYLESSDIFKEAFAAMEKMEWEKAISGFKNVLSMDPRHIQSHGNIGLCYGHLGKKQEAIASLDRALEIDPKYEVAIINRKAISSLAEGEKLPSRNLKSVDYYKDYPMKKESLIRKLFG